MAFHHEFWVVAGTAGPVIALAHAVAAQQAIEKAFATFRRVRPPIELGHWVETGHWHRSDDQAVRPKRSRGEDLRHTLASVMMLLPMFAAVAGVGIGGLVLDDSLKCLAAEADRFTRTSIRRALEWSLLLLAFQLAASLIVDRVITYRGAPKPK